MILRALLICSISLPTFGATLDSDGSHTDVQSKIDSASSGDTVTIPSGTFNWTTEVTIPDTKGITIQGAGQATSVILRGVGVDTSLLSFDANASTMTRITALTFRDTHTSDQGTHSWHIHISGGPTASKFRIDNCTFTNEDAMRHVIKVTESTFGLIDHCKFYSGMNSEYIHNWGRSTTTSEPDWTNDVTPGSYDALYIEDCAFTNNILNFLMGTYYFQGNSAIQGYYGCRSVLRFNLFWMSHIDMHGGNIGARWWECYTNQFIVKPGDDGNQDRYFGLRGGSGVIFNNWKTGGDNGGNGTIDLGLQASDSATYRVGRGKNLALDPTYVWGNTANDDTMGVGDGGDVVENTDYYLSAKPGYTPAAYPHPLQGGEEEPATPLPRIKINPGVSTSGKVQFSLMIEPSGPFVLEGSPDLLAWIPSLVSYGEWRKLEIEPALQSPQRFWRMQPYD